MKKVLVTGSAGFIGFHMARHLLAEGFRVHGYDGLTGAYDVALKRHRHAMLHESPHFTATEALLQDRAGFDALADDFAPEVIIHLAAESTPYGDTEPQRSQLDANLIGACNVIEAARRLKVGHLLMASSAAVYGTSEKTPFAESEIADRPLTLDAATVKAAESVAHAYAHLWDLPVTIFRFFTAYGPWARPDTVPSIYTDAVFELQPLNISNRGDIYRDFTYVEDLVRAVRLLIDAVPHPPGTVAAMTPGDNLSPAGPFRVVNIGTADPVRLTDFVDVIEAIVGRPALRNFTQIRRGEMPAIWTNADLLAQLTGYRLQTPIHEGVAAFVDWFREYYRK